MTLPSLSLRGLGSLRRPGSLRRLGLADRVRIPTGANPRVH